MAGSATTYTYKNPAFTVIDIDAEFMLPTNIHTYFFNLSDSQTPDSSSPISWRELHDFLETYQMKDLSPDSFDALANKVLNDE